MASEASPLFHAPDLIKFDIVEVLITLNPNPLNIYICFLSSKGFMLEIAITWMLHQAISVLSQLLQHFDLAQIS